jgi:hypothetical protein
MAHPPGAHPAFHCPKPALSVMKLPGVTSLPSRAQPCCGTPRAPNVPPCPNPHAASRHHGTPTRCRAATSFATPTGRGWHPMQVSRLLRGWRVEAVARGEKSPAEAGPVSSHWSGTPPCSERPVIMLPELSGLVDGPRSRLRRSPAAWLQFKPGDAVHSRLMLLRMLVAAAAIAEGGATADPCSALVGIPIGISVARRATLRSESLTVGDENRQHAGECKCHNAHCHLSFDVSGAGLVE